MNLKNLDKNSFSIDDVFDYVKERHQMKKEKKEIKKDLRRFNHEKGTDRR